MTYPLGVTAAGALAQAAWDRRPASTGPYTITFPADAPAAFREQFGTYYANLGKTLTSVDLGPFNLFLNDGVYGITNLHTSGTVGQYPIAVGHGDNGGAATLTLTTASIDMTNAHNYGRIIVGGGTLNLTLASVLNASVTSIESYGDVNLSKVYIKDFGLNPEADPALHAEGLHPHAGNGTVRETFIHATAGVNLLIHLESDVGPVVYTIEDSPLSVDDGINTGYYPIQISPRNGNPITLIMNRVSIKKGVTGYVLVNSGVGFSGTVLGLATDCFDEVTGDNIDATINSQFSGPPVTSGGGTGGGGTGGGTDTGDGTPTGGTSGGTGGGSTGTGDFFPPSTSGTGGSSTSEPPASPPSTKTAKPHRKSLLSTISSAVQSFVAMFGALLSGKRSSDR